MSGYYGPRSRGGGSSGASRSSPYGLYTPSGAPVYNPEKYAAAGGKCVSSNGSQIRNVSAYADTVQAAKTQASSNPSHYFHYTDKESAAAISASGRLQPSASGALGGGLYVTSKAPNNKTAKILENNYGGAAGSSASRADKADAYVRIPAGAVEGRVTSGRDELGRNVHKIGGAVDLKEAGAVVRKKK